MTDLAIPDPEPRASARATFQVENPSPARRIRAATVRERILCGTGF